VKIGFSVGTAAAGTANVGSGGGAAFANAAGGSSDFFRDTCRNANDNRPPASGDAAGDAFPGDVGDGGAAAGAGAAEGSSRLKEISSRKSTDMRTGAGKLSAEAIRGVPGSSGRAWSTETTGNDGIFAGDGGGSESGKDAVFMEGGRIFV
jgi:hypothetical protein